MKLRLAMIGSLLLFVFGTEAVAGSERVDTRMATAQAVSEARGMVSALFKNLKEGKTEEIAKWIVEEVQYSSDAATKVKNAAEFKAQLDVVLLSPPASSLGKLDGYDQIDEAYLPGSSRYFRLSYISYHEGAPLVWEFRFYVRPDNSVSLNSISWDPKNPFEFLATSDMLLKHWANR